jgi:hypothetical protein
MTKITKKLSKSKSKKVQKLFQIRAYALYEQMKTVKYAMPSELVAETKKSDTLVEELKRDLKTRVK